MHSNMTREELKRVFELAKESKSDVYIAIVMPGQDDYEYIINKNKSIDNKLEYYCKAYDEEFVTNKVSAKFVMLRNFKIMNDIVVDDNIYFIEKDLFDKYKEALINKKDNDILVFPTNTEGMHYSKSFNNFNDTFLEEDLTKNLLVYNIYEKTINEGKYEFNLKSIKCNTIKIYHPHIKTDNKLIVHIVPLYQKVS